MTKFINLLILIVLISSCKKETPKEVSALSISSVTGITSTSVHLNYEITSDGGSDITATGFCWSTNSNPTISDSKTIIGVGLGTFTGTISGLYPGTIYYVRAYAINSVGTAYSGQFTFTTTAILPTIVTKAITQITGTSVVCGGDITSDGGSPILTKGICWSTSQNPTFTDSQIQDGTGSTSFMSSISGLTSSKIYYLRAYATNNIGVSYGNSIQVTTLTVGPQFNTSLTYGTLTDIDGNIYKTIKIGTQTWMAENLRVTHGRDGTPIPNVTDNTLWTNSSSGAYCVYNNDTKNLPIYGAIYNGYCALQLPLAPTGWHIPEDTEWNTLISYLGGSTACITKLGESSSAHWEGLKSSFSNESGFTLMPSGSRGSSGLFSVSISTSSVIWGHIITSSFLLSEVFFADRTESMLSNFYREGYSIRCIKDN